MTLQQLRYAVEVANRGSMNEAAKKLYVSQPSLSSAIRELEREIGISIFNRTNQGISVSAEGKEFLCYALQIVEQENQLKEHYLGAKPSKQKFGISTQHYTFAINAFVRLLKEMDPGEFDFTFRETTTEEVIKDVQNRRSEIGILYMNHFNARMILKNLEEAGLEFAELFQSKSYIYVTDTHPLARKKEIKFRDLKPYTFLSFGKGEYNSNYFSEEILKILEHRRNIKVSDRSTLFYLLRKLGGFTICTQMVNKELQGEDIVAVPLNVEGAITVGFVLYKDECPGDIGKRYMEIVREDIGDLL